MHSETMSLVGGIDMSFGRRYESNVAPKGRKVIFLNQNGHEYEREDARLNFSVGQILTVKEIFVGGFKSTVEFIELPNEEFNTVMFADVELRKVKRR